MAWREKGKGYVVECSDLHFKEYQQGEEPSLSGIYRCVACGDCSLEIVHIGGTALPHHEQNCGIKPIWKLIVFPHHPSYYPCQTVSLRRR